ncbi:hypothetical protein CR513_59070, partial [Mucuna pruriens]
MLLITFLAMILYSPPCFLLNFLISLSWEMDLRLLLKGLVNSYLILSPPNYPLRLLLLSFLFLMLLYPIHSIPQDVQHEDPLTVQPLQTYHHCQRSTMVTEHATILVNEAMPDSSSMPTLLLDLARPPDLDLLITVRKGTFSTRNPSPHYINLSYHRLSPMHYTCLSS